MVLDRRGNRCEGRVRCTGGRRSGGRVFFDIVCVDPFLSIKAFCVAKINLIHLSELLASKAL